MNFNDNKPIYLQIAESLMDSIVRGDLPDETRLPSVRDYAIEAGVNPANIQVTDHCTYHEPELFCSYRREGGTYMRMGAGLVIRNR